MRTCCAIVLGLAALVGAGVVRAQEEKKEEGDNDRMPLFEALDKDGDGKVGREEFRGPARAFDRLDADHDGSLAPDEIEKGVAAPRPGDERPGDGDRPGEGVREPGRDPFRDADRDGDGKISRDEALTLFDRFDADDGFVTREEPRQAAGRAREGRGGSRREPDGDRPAGQDRDREKPQDHPEGKGADRPSR